MLGLRLLCGVPLFFILVGLFGIDIYFRCGWGLASILALFAVFGAREFCRFANCQDKQPFTVWAMFFAAALFFATEYTQLYSAASFISFAPHSEQIIFISFFLAIFLRQLFQNECRQVINTLSATLLAVGYFWFFLSYIIRLRHLAIPGASRFDWAEQGVELIFTFFVASKVCDIAGLIVGKKFGRHKLWRAVSPQKSWEGFFGGMAASVFVLAALILIHPQSALAYCGYAKILPLGILFSIFGLFGDLCESLIKREAQLKDAGGALPGYGGAMDMLDSLTFNAPIAYYYFIFVCGAVHHG